MYLQILQEQAGKYGLEVLGYCLMTNHVHIVAIPHEVRRAGSVRARLCRRAWAYEWSSAAAHTDERAESDLLNLPWWYKQFVSKLETLLGRRVRALPVGRPRKEPTEAGRHRIRRE